MERLRDRIGIAIKRLRESKDLSQAELGEKSGYHSTTIGRFEKANRDISADSIEELADALGYNVKILFTEKPDINKLKILEV